MKRILYLLFLISFTANASHIVGGELTYKFIGNSQYVLMLDLYRSCSSTISAPTNPSVTIKSASCAVSTAVLLTMTNEHEVSNYCNGAPTNCGSGTLIGVQKFTYVDTVTLTPCDDWIFGYELCCRSGIITDLNMPTVTDIYIYSTLNNSTFDSSSPTFSTDQVPFVCAGNSYCFDNTAIGGDSVVYEMIPPLNTSVSDVSYINPFTYLQPLSTTATFSNGEFCFTDNTIEVGVAAFLVKNYVNGVLINQIERDITIIVTSCPCTALPVSLISFSATSQDKNVLLKWSTSLQLNNDSFELYIFNESWDLFGGVAGQRFSDYVMNYDYLYQPSLTDDIFMLTQKDYDGKETWLGYASDDPKFNNIYPESSIWEVLDSARCNLLGQKLK